VSKYLKSIDSDWFRRRLTAQLICVALGVLALLLRLFYLQVVRGPEFRKLSLNNSIRLQAVDAPRGLIMDRHGELLVDNRPSFDLNISPKDAQPIKETVRRLSMVLEAEDEDFMAKVADLRGAALLRPLLLKRDIGRDALGTVETRRYDLPGIDVSVRLLRHYVDGGMAAHLIGYLGEINPSELQCDIFAGCRSGDLIGKFGVEKSFEHLLRGQRGGRQVEVNASGQVVRVLRTVPAQNGHNVFLTIDGRLQRRAEELLAGFAGAAVAVDPTTGDILALASSPTFDQNHFITGLSRDQWSAVVNNPWRPLENKALQGEYPPASTYKILTALAGLEEKVITPQEVLFCPGHYRFGNRDYRCWRRGGHGQVDLNRAIAESCDVYFYQVGQRLGIDRLAFYAKAAGLGKRTGIDLDHESSGLVPTADWKRRRTGIAWQEGETLSVAIGQGFNLVTPLQMAVFAATVGNGGVRYRPQIVARVVTPEGEVVQERQPQVAGRLPIGLAVLQTVQRGMWEVVNGERGTARIARLKEVAISGKTGTAQVVSREKAEAESSGNVHHYKDHAWFIAYAPSEAPRIAIAVIVEHGEHGSSAASPVAREMVRTYLGLGEDLKTASRGAP
jgi:penicillin-binding protein 2